MIADEHQLIFNGSLNTNEETLEGFKYLWLAMQSSVEARTVRTGLGKIAIKGIAVVASTTQTAVNLTSGIVISKMQDLIDVLCVKLPQVS